MLVAARPNETMRPAPCAAYPLRTRCAALGRAPGCSSRTKGPSCCQSCPSCRTRRCARPLPSRSRPDRDRCMRGRRQTPSLRVPLLLRSVHPRDRCHLRAPLSARDGQRDVRAAPRGRSRVAAFVCRECRIGVLRPPLFWTIKTEECAWRPTLRVARTDECLRLYRRATAAARARRTSRRARGTSTAQSPAAVGSWSPASVSTTGRLWSKSTLKPLWSSTTSRMGSRRTRLSFRRSRCKSGFAAADLLCLSSRCRGRTAPGQKKIESSSAHPWIQHISQSIAVNIYGIDDDGQCQAWCKR